jgi:hypothetical protein
MHAAVNDHDDGYGNKYQEEAIAGEVEHESADEFHPSVKQRDGHINAGGGGGTARGKVQKYPAHSDETRAIASVHVERLSER